MGSVLLLVIYFMGALSDEEQPRRRLNPKCVAVRKPIKRSLMARRAPVHIKKHPPSVKQHQHMKEMATPSANLSHCDANSPLESNVSLLCDFDVWFCGYPIGKAVMRAVFEGCNFRELTAKTTEESLRASAKKGGIWFTSGGSILCKSVDKVARAGLTVVDYDVEHGENFYLTPRPFWPYRPKKIVYLGVNETAYVTRQALEKWGLNVPASRQIFLSVAAGTVVYGNISAQTLLEPRRKESKKRNTFLVYAQDRNEKHRQLAYDAIVDFCLESGLPSPIALGLCYGSKPQTWRPFNQKHDNVLSVDNKRSTRFVLTMENFLDISGRVSEKLIDAYLAGAIAVYAGPPGVEHIFNTEALVWIDPQNPGPGLQKLRALETNQTLYDYVRSQPLLTDGLKTLNKYFSLTDHLGDGSLKKQIRQLVDCVRTAK